MRLTSLLINQGELLENWFTWACQNSIITIASNNDEWGIVAWSRHHKVKLFLSYRPFTTFLIYDLDHANKIEQYKYSGVLVKQWKGQSDSLTNKTEEYERNRVLIKQGYRQPEMLIWLPDYLWKF